MAYNFLVYEERQSFLMPPSILYWVRKDQEEISGWHLFGGASALMAWLALGLVGCGGDDGGCPGRTCHDCSASGDCDIECDDGETEVCGHLGYFDDPDLRCVYCEDS